VGIDWERKIDELLATKASEKESRSKANQESEAATAANQRRANDYARTTLVPALTRVKAMLEKPGRDREVEIDERGPNSILLIVWAPGGPHQKGIELYLRFAFDVSENAVRLTTERGKEDRWYSVSSTSGNIESISEEDLFETSIEQWIQSVEREGRP
jgi:hypothetical protein